MNFDQFMNSVKAIKSPPETFLQARLLDAVTSADAGVHATFFAGQPVEPFLTTHEAADAQNLRQLAVEYLSFALSANTSLGFNATVQNISYGTIQSWFSINTNTVGQDIFTDYLMQPSVLGPFFTDGATNAKAIADEAASSDFLTGLLVECDTIGSSLPAKVLLLTLRLLDNDGPNFKRVLQAWVVNPRWSTDLEGFDRYPWLDAVEPSFRQGAPAFGAVFQAVAVACGAQTIYSRDVPDMNGFGTLSTWVRTTYGAGVVQWVNSSGGPPAFGLASGKAPSNVTDVRQSNGCVRAGTPILLADGSTTPVERLQEGDEVASGGGAVSVCSAELVVNDQLTGLYSFNDDPPFMSFEHAVMTQRGWCSLAPEVTMSFVPHHAVKRLDVGDVVWRLASKGDDRTEYEKIVVERINVETFAAGKGPTGYDLHLRGHHSYHARGYCCLVNYPEITVQHITSNMVSNMSNAEQLAFGRTLGEIEPMLSKALGKGVVSAVASALRDPRRSAARAAHTDAHGVRRRAVAGAAHLVLPTMKVEAHGASAPGRAFDQLGVYQGRLFVDGEPVASHADGDHLYWHRRLDSGVEETGALRLAAHGLLGHGAVSYGGAPLLFTAAGLVGYTTEAGSDRTPWYEFDMGFTRDDKGLLHALGEVTVPGDATATANLQKYSTVVFSVATNKQSLTVLHAELNVDPQLCQFGGSAWVAAELDFTMDYRAFAGTIYPFDQTKPGFRGDGVAVHGTCKDLAKLQAMMTGSTSRMLAQPIDSALLRPNPASAPVPAPIAQAMQLAGALPMSAEQLFLVPPPDMTNVHELSFGKLKSLMLLALSKRDAANGTQWLQWFGETAPAVGQGQALSDSDAAMLQTDEVNAFLVDKFAIGYLTQAFSKSTDPNIQAQFAKLSSVDDKLGYFWKGDGTTSFSQSKAYSQVTAKLLDSSYSDTVPELAPYLQSDPVGWAQKLYEYCTDPLELTGLALQNTVDNRQRLTHLSTLLHVLDPAARVVKPDGKSVSYATSLYERVMDYRLNEVLKFVGAGTKEDFVGFLTEFFRQYFASLLVDGKWGDAIRGQAVADLQALMAEYQVDNVNALVDGMGNMIADMVDVLRTAKGIMPARLKVWADNNPRKSKFIAGSLSIAVYGFGIWQSIQALLGWGQLKPAEQVQTVTQILDVTINIFNDVVTYTAAQKLATATSSLEDLMEATGQIQTELDFTRLTEAADKIAVQVDIELDDLAAPALARAGEVAGVALTNAEGLAAAASRWTKFAQVTEVMARGITIIAMGAACVATGFQIAADFASGQPTAIKVFDILGEVANGVAFLVEGGIGIAALVGIEVLSAIPIVGVVAAIVGILVAFIEMFIHRKPPPTPEQVFVTEQSAPFVNALALPDNAWLQSQKRVEAHLDTPPSLRPSARLPAAPSASLGTPPLSVAHAPS